MEKIGMVRKTRMSLKKPMPNKKKENLIRKQDITIYNTIQTLYNEISNRNNKRAIFNIYILLVVDKRALDDLYGHNSDATAYRVLFNLQSCRVWSTSRPCRTPFSILFPLFSSRNFLLALSKHFFSTCQHNLRQMNLPV